MSLVAQVCNLHHRAANMQISVPFRSEQRAMIHSQAGDKPPRYVNAGEKIRKNVA